jgi:hypothetical protein
MLIAHVVSNPNALIDSKTSYLVKTLPGTTEKRNPSVESTTWIQLYVASPPPAVHVAETMR